MENNEFGDTDEYLNMFFDKLFEHLIASKIFFAILIPITFILCFIYFYFVLAAILQLTVYSFVYDALSLFGKEKLELGLAICTNLSNFGMFYILALFCVFVIKDLFSIIKLISRIYILVIKGKKDELSKNKDFSDLKSIIRIELLNSDFGETYKKFLYKVFNNQNPNNIIGMIIGIIYITLIILCILLLSGLVSTNGLILIYIKLFEIMVLVIIFLGHQIFYLLTIFIQILNSTCFHSNNSKKPCMSSHNESSNSLEESDGNDHVDNNNDYDDKKNNEIYSNGLFSFVKISLLNGMFEKEKDSKCPKLLKFYKIVVCIIIIGLQIYQILYSYKKKTITGLGFALFFWMKVIFIYKILSYNIIDGIIRIPRTIKSLFDIKAKIVYCLIVLLYILSFVVFIVLGKYFNDSSVYPTVKSARYIQTNERWMKINDIQSILPESYCFSKSKIDGTLKTEDFAMLATLPRLYNISDKTGKCFIKPSMRGLFNTTMKYIFGKEYENDNILIFCKKFTHYPILIITSDKILEQATYYFSEGSYIKILPKQFQIKNKEYFKVNPITYQKLPKIVQKYYSNYIKCTKESKNKSRCEIEWDEFTQSYWTNMYSDEFVDIPGFERYQITLESNMIIQPSFITKTGKLMSGTHYIVGGSFEDKWGVGLFMESFGRQYLPILFGNFIPLYQFIRTYYRSLFLNIESFNRKLVNPSTIATKDMTLFTELFTQFNFSHEALFTIGHSISGTEMKGVSYFTDIQGITFEASNGENIGDFDLFTKFSKSKNSKNNIVNVYSNKNVFSGIDKDCLINGELPERYYVPSVYDTACLTAISCSQNKKYIPFCKQILTQKGKDPIKEFNLSLDAYLSKYDYI